MKSLTLTIETTTVQTDCSILIMHVQGKLNGENYIQLIDAAQALHNKNHRNLILDLTELQRISLAGLFALHSVAAIFNDQEPLDPEGGWQALRTMKVGLDLQARFKLSNPQPPVRSLLAQSGFDTFITIYDDLLRAIESFGAGPTLEIVLPETAVIINRGKQNGANKNKYHIARKTRPASPPAVSVVTASLLFGMPINSSAHKMQMGILVHPSALCTQACCDCNSGRSK